MEVIINNQPVNVPDSLLTVTLLAFLRDIAGLTGTKYGCGAGLCGACTVHVDGEAVRACQTYLDDVLGQSVTTIEGLAATAPDDGLHPVQQAWIEESVPQCGYCQPGQIMQATAFLKETPHPSDEDINEAMSGNICRCGTYVRIHKAIQRAAKEMSHD